MTDAERDEITRVHERLDEVIAGQGKIQADLSEIKAHCTPCRASVDKHEKTLYGNGQAGITSRVAACEQGRQDTISIKSAIALIGAGAAGTASIIGAMAAFAK